MVNRSEEDYYSGNTPLSVLYGLACQDMPVGGDEVREAIRNFEREVQRAAVAKQQALRDQDPWIARSVLIDSIDPDKEST